jgi:hypothetical protein
VAFSGHDVPFACACVMCVIYACACACVRVCVYVRVACACCSGGMRHVPYAHAARSVLVRVRRLRVCESVSSSENDAASVREGA